MTISPELHWCVIDLNLNNRVRRSATTVLSTSDGTVCVCEHHAELIDEQLSTVDNILRARKGSDVSRHAT